MPFLKEKLEVEISEAELRVEKSFLSLPIWLRWTTTVFIISLILGFFVSNNLATLYWKNRLAPFAEKATPSFTEVKTLRVTSISVTRSAKNTYSAAAAIVNDNLDLSATGVEYAFEFYNARNQVVAPAEGVVRGTTYVLPNQTQYVVVSKIITSEAITSANVVINKKRPLWQKKLDIPKAKITADVPQWYNQLSPLAFAVDGAIRNTSPYRIREVQLVFLVYDKQKNIIALSLRSEYDLQPYERRTYKQLWPGVYTDQVETVKVVPQVNVLDSQNLTLPEVPKNAASDLSR